MVNRVKVIRLDGNLFNAGSGQLQIKNQLKGWNQTRGRDYKCHHFMESQEGRSRKGPAPKRIRTHNLMNMSRCATTTAKGGKVLLSLLVLSWTFRVSTSASIKVWVVCGLRSQRAVRNGTDRSVNRTGQRNGTVRAFNERNGHKRNGLPTVWPVIERLQRKQTVIERFEQAWTVQWPYFGLLQTVRLLKRTVIDRSKRPGFWKTDRFLAKMNRPVKGTERSEP